MYKLSIYFIISSIIHLQCNDGEKKKEESVQLQFKSNLLPQLGATSDTVYILYYNTPGDHRYYKELTTSKKILQSLIRDINGTINSGKSQCITEGKIHFYGRGEEVYTIYFNKQDSCRNLSFMVGAEKYFTGMGDKTKYILDSLAKSL